MDLDRIQKLRSTMALSGGVVSTPAQPFRRPREREEREEWWRWRTGERRALGSNCVLLSSWGLLYIGGEGCTLTPPPRQL
jgi:hypothetical protein